MLRLNRFLSLIALLLLIAVSCHAEGDCANVNEEGLCANPDAATDEVTEEAVATEATEEDPNCPSRAYVIRCAGKYLDTNQNGKLERAELETAINSLPWYSRGLLQILGSVDKMMKKCDMDGDDAISMTTDMEQNKDQCLATCFKRKAFKSAFFPDCE
ncbi:unnamed protein product [Cylindrotheca closterium]|uniref:Calmodulin n=1 Tax=Cylindrotheca closterium TaxID=2856 RepID=A0AAD2JND0_9STRA|nr:unnamed protein product [Cylindrotheca closterium]